MSTLMLGATVVVAEEEAGHGVLKLLQVTKASDFFPDAVSTRFTVRLRTHGNIKFPVGSFFTGKFGLFSYEGKIISSRTFAHPRFRSLQGQTLLVVERQEKSK